MRYTVTVAFVLTLFATAVNAHFSLNFPPPRGTFNAANEVNFCDGYTTPAANRTQFPLSDGYITLRTGHPHWTSGVLFSTAQNPTAWENFTLVTGYSSTQLPGNYCLPLDFSKSSAASGLQAGQNITIQVVWNGGDGNLYQCADLTLVAGLNLSSTVPCTNTTVTSSSSAPSATSTKSSASSDYVKSLTFLTALTGFVGLLVL